MLHMCGKSSGHTESVRVVVADQEVKFLRLVCFPELIVVKCFILRCSAAM